MGANGFALPLALSCAFALPAGLFLSRAWLTSFRRGKRPSREKLFSQDAGLDGLVLGQVLNASARVALRASMPVKVGDRSRRRFEQLIAHAGLNGKATADGCALARLLLAALGVGIGAVVGALFSTLLALVTALVGAFAGFCSVSWCLREQARKRVEDLERHLPEMLEVLALGLRSGLAFDRCMELYCQHFHTELAQECASAQAQWSLGLLSREQALKNLASSYDSAQFHRVVDGMVRSLRFGSSLAEVLERSSAEARASYRARKQEQVAKAPVKMMVPTGTLMLPAMLLLVLGPILLELIGGF